MNREVLLEGVKQAVRESGPGAEIILYGSHSRRDSDTQSDWDLGVLVDDPVNDERVDRIPHHLCELEGRYHDEILCTRFCLENTHLDVYY